MIRCRWAQQGEELTLEVTGHAGFAPAGEDLVCAGVTALVYALAQTVEQWAAAPQISLQPGSALIRAKGEQETLPRLLAAFQTVINGLKLLADQFPEHVSCKI